MRIEIIQRQLNEARARAAGLHDAALACTPEQSALRARLMGAAHGFDTLIALVESLALIAKINHDTVVHREAS